MKKLNFVFDWIGPNGPMRNGEIPDIMNLIKLQNGINNDLNFKDMYPMMPPLFENENIKINIFSSYHFPKNNFLYEIATARHVSDQVKNLEGIISNHNNKFISNIVIEQVRNKIGYIVFHNPFESFLEDPVLNSLHKNFNELNIPLSQVIYSSCCPNAKEVYADFCQRNNMQPELNCEYLPTFYLYLKDRVRNIDVTYSPGPKEKDFLCFNRRYRRHRLIFGLLLEKANLLDRCFFSLDSRAPELKTSFEDFVHEFPELSHFGIDNTIINRFSNKLPLIIDSYDYVENNFTDVQNFKTDEFYNNSLIHIISETNFFTNIIHQTEKSFKPIVHLQPFIMLSSPYSLKSIQNMGFKTFSEFWDESYDSETDHYKRLIKIIDLCKEISEWPAEKKIEFTHLVKPILEFNFDHFMKGPTAELNKWTEAYGN